MTSSYAGKRAVAFVLGTMMISPLQAKEIPADTNTQTVVSANGAEEPQSGTSQPTPDQPTPDQATPGQTEPATSLEDIVVTARRTNERLQDVPIAVTALTGAQLEARSLTNLKGIAQFTPNLYFSNSGAASPNQSTVFIRGVGQADNLITADPGVGIYVDGVYLARAQGAVLDLVDLERIEVLRGPQGTLFGKNTIGGAINIVSRSPTFENAGEVNLTVGNRKRIDAGGTINIPLSDNLAVKVSAVSRNRDCLYRRPSDDACYGDEATQSARAYIRYQPTQSFTADLIVDATHSSSHSLPQGVLAINEAEPGIADYNARVQAGLVPGPMLLESDVLKKRRADATDGNLPTDGRLNVFGASLNLQYVTGPVTLHSITAYRQESVRSTQNIDGSVAQYIETISTSRGHQFSQEFRADGKAFNDNLSYVAGLYYFREFGFSSETELVPVIFGNFFGTGGYVQPDRQVSRSYAAFASASLNLTRKLRLSGGLRYTRDEKDFTGARRGVNSATFDQIPLTSSSDSSDVVTPKASIDYRPTDHLLFYASASRGYRSGGFNGRAGSVFAVVTPYRPEFVWSYEGGIKSEFFDRRVRLNLAGFRSDYSDRQEGVVVVVPGTTNFEGIVANAAAVRITGFEAELTAAFTKRLRVEASTGYTNARYMKIDPSVTSITLQSTIPYVPKWTVTTSAEYSLPLAAFHGDLVTRVDYSYRSKVAFDPSNTIYSSQDGFSLVNARMTFKPDNSPWEISLFGRNLTNKRYKVYSNDLLSSAFGIAFAQYNNDRRELGLTAKYKFN